MFISNECINYSFGKTSSACFIQILIVNKFDFAKQFNYIFKNNCFLIYYIILTKRKKYIEVFCIICCNLLVGTEI